MTMAELGAQEMAANAGAGPAPLAEGFDQVLDGIFAPISDALSAIVFASVPVFGADLPLIVVWLMAAAIFLTVWLRFQPLRGAAHSIAVIRGRFTKTTDPGEVSTFQALATELSGTVGLGNIAGVAVAIAAGGPGAALWIVIFGLLAMSVKMAEATLGVKYRVENPDGSYSGGPMHYLRRGLAEIGRPRTGGVLAVAYAIFTLIGVFGAGNLFQANQVAAILGHQLGDGTFLDANRWLTGLILAVLAAAVILGGITSIGRWTARITPAMAVLYFACVIAILVANAGQVPAAAATIVTSAFTAEGVTGGAIGVAIIGIQRALFSNAAGVGSAGMAHAASKTREPATEGYAAMWEPLIDSVVICTLTSLAIVVTGVYQHGDAEGGTAEGVAMTSQAFGTVASWFPVLLTVAVVLFGFSTILSYGYYGELAATFLFGSKKAVRIGFRIVWVLAVVLGAAVSLDAVIGFSDAMFFLMSVPNLLGIYFLAKVLRLEILRHKHRVDVGVLEPAPEHLRIGMSTSHEPEPEHVEEERQRLEDLDTKALEIRRALDAEQAARASAPAATAVLEDDEEPGDPGRRWGQR